MGTRFSGTGCALMGRRMRGACTLPVLSWRVLSDDEFDHLSKYLKGCLRLSVRVSLCMFSVKPYMDTRCTKEDMAES